MSKNAIKDKSFEFSLAVLDMYKTMIENKQFVLANQVLRSGTSIGANVHEASGALTNREFVAKMQIAYKECLETLYWLELIREASLCDKQTINLLHSKCDELRRILSSILITSKNAA
jgi:four helix bundle protein